jgi:hypothetical protein
MVLCCAAIVACAERHPDHRTNGPPMRFAISIPSHVRQGEPVPVTLTLTNTSPQPITAYLTGRPTAFDVEVADNSGQVIWRRLAGETVPAILGVRTLAPGEALTFETTWPQRDQRGRPAAPGRYTLSGVLATDAEPLRSLPAELRIFAAP